MRHIGGDESDRGKAGKGCKNDMLHLPLETEIKWIQSRESEAHRSQKARNQEPDKTCGNKCDYWDFACQQSFKKRSNKGNCINCIKCIRFKQSLAWQVPFSTVY